MKALVLVDIQNDFLPGGTLAVPNGNEVIAIANRLQPRFEVVVATQDWHPANHGSFAANYPGKKVGDAVVLNGLRQILWPVHCVQATEGAAFGKGLNNQKIERIFPKGIDPENADSYSGFYDNGAGLETGLQEYLRNRGVEMVYVMGLATDYCVKHTALDAAKLGFQSVLIEDGCRGVNLQPGDTDLALEQMRNAGVTVLRSTEILTRLEASLFQGGTKKNDE